MYGLIRTILLFFAFLVLSSESLLAWPWGPQKLVTINDTVYTTEDFKHWWASWKEEDSVFSESLEQFIDWHLLAQEAKTMELFRSPSYQSKIQTFLKVRALLLLKKEEVDSKIKVTDSEIKKHYNLQYNPIWHAEIVYVDNENDADQLYAAVKSGKQSFDYVRNHPVDSHSTIRFEERNLTPKTFEKAQEWLPILQGLSVGELSKPIPMGSMYVMVRLKEKSVQQPDHYESVQKSIYNDLWKKQQGLYTRELIADLKKKYNVQINRDLLAKALKPDIPAEDLDKTLISTERKHFPLRIVVDKIRKEKELMTRVTFTEEKLTDLRDGIVNGILSQVLITWESLDRHYEKRPPLKPIFEFYTQHRLIRELERRFMNQANISDTDISAYYAKNINDFVQPETISFARLIGETELINKIWGAVTHGEDFFTASRKYFFHDPPIENLSYDKIEPAVRNVLKGLTVGEVSRPFPDNNQMNLIKLLGKKKESPLPIDHVKNDIVEKIKKEKQEQIRANYLAKLRANSTINVNEKNWESLKHEFGKTNADS